MKRLQRWGALLAGSTLVVGCATQIVGSGGAADTLPPSGSPTTDAPQSAGSTRVGAGSTTADSAAGSQTVSSESASGRPDAGRRVGIGFQGPLGGPYAELGVSQSNAINLAVNEANASGELPFTLEMWSVDDRGLTEEAAGSSSAMIENPAVVAVIGPVLSGEVAAAGTLYSQAGLTIVSASATRDVLTQSGFDTFHRVVASDGEQGRQTAHWLAANTSSLYLIDDGSDYGLGAANDISNNLADTGVVLTRQTLLPDAADADYQAMAAAVIASQAGAVFFSGYDTQGGLIAQALSAAGYSGIRMAGEATNTAAFVESGGAATQGWYLTCGCLSGPLAPAAQDFESKYQLEFGVPSGMYAVEAYDAALMLIGVLKDVALQGEITREAIEIAVDEVDVQGLTAPISFAFNGELAAPEVYLYQVQAGAIGFVGGISAS